MVGVAPRAYTASMTTTDVPATTPFALGGAFLDALAGRDFTAMAGLLAEGAQLRALLPKGPMERTGPEAIVERFAFWFGQAPECELVDGTVGAIGDRLHLSWRLRLRPTPGGAAGWHLVEQQAYVDATDRIDAIALVCSGFVAERPEG